MVSPTSDSSFVEELAADVEAYLQRCNVLTDFAESQVEERVRLARLVNRLASDRDGLQVRIGQLERHIEVLEAQLGPLEKSIVVRLSRAPQRLWRVLRRRTQ